MKTRLTSIITVLTIILLLFFPFAVSAQMVSESILTGTAWLLNVRYDHNIWAFTTPPDPEQTEFTLNDYTRTYVRDTFSATLTLQALNIDAAEYAPTIDWVEYTLPQSTEFIAQKIIILNKAGKDVSEPLSLLLDNRKTNGGFAGAKRYPSNNRDTAFALQSFRAVDYSDQDVIDRAISYLLSTQNTDGGYGFYQGYESNVYTTALVSITLQQFQRTTSIATAINKATSYLIAHQNTDGGFAHSTSSGQGDSTVYETAYAYMALVGFTTDAMVLGNAINYLTSAQLPNGSWDDDPYSTALALRALANVKPNLSISSSDITFSNPTPIVGEIITITATIHNEGPGVAPSTGSGQVTVQFYDGDPSAGGVLIGETTIQSIPAFGSSQASIEYTIPTASSKTIFIKVDPLNTIDELICSKNDYKKLSKLLQKNHSFYDRLLFSFMVKHSMTCSRCSHSDKVMYYGRF